MPGGSADAARSIIDSSLYMVLATADETGRPWASPVYFAVSGYAEFFWVSSPEATHSRNISVRPEVGIVIFDSRVPIGTGQGVYMPAAAEQVTGPELQRGIDVFSRRSLEHGGGCGRRTTCRRRRGSDSTGDGRRALDARQGRPS
jgi:Pyridoxamine 5'-phosphate oxidase